MGKDIRQWNGNELKIDPIQNFRKPTAGNSSGFFFIHTQPQSKPNPNKNKIMNKSKNNPRTSGFIKKSDPLNALSKVLNELVLIYEEAGVPSPAARIAALADFECDFGVLPLAA
jgi:hypothetical protein